MSGDQVRNRNMSDRTSVLLPIKTWPTTLGTLKKDSWEESLFDINWQTSSLAEYWARQNKG